MWASAGRGKEAKVKAWDSCRCRRGNLSKEKFDLQMILWQRRVPCWQCHRHTTGCFDTDRPSCLGLDDSTSQGVQYSSGVQQWWHTVWWQKERACSWRSSNWLNEDNFQDCPGQFWVISKEKNGAICFGNGGNSKTREVFKQYRIPPVSH